MVFIPITARRCWTSSITNHRPRRFYAGLPLYHTYVHPPHHHPPSRRAQAPGPGIIHLSIHLAQIPQRQVPSAQPQLSAAAACASVCHISFRQHLHPSSPSPSIGGGSGRGSFPHLGGSPPSLSPPSPAFQRRPLPPITFSYTTYSHFLPCKQIPPITFP